MRHRLAALDSGAMRKSSFLRPWRSARRPSGIAMIFAINPTVMGGKPVIHGTRLTVQYILKLLADGWSFGDIKKEYQGISDQDISACILYASEILDDVEFIPLREAM